MSAWSGTSQSVHQQSSGLHSVPHQTALGPARAPEPSEPLAGRERARRRRFVILQSADKRCLTFCWSSQAGTCLLTALSSVQAPKSPQTSSVHTSQLDHRAAELSASSSLTRCYAELPAGPCPCPCPVPAEQLSQSARPPQTPPLALETVSPAQLPQSPFSAAESTSPSLRPVLSPLSSQSPASTSREASPLVENLCSVSLGDHFPPDKALPGRHLRGTWNPQAERKDEEDHLESGKWTQGRKRLLS